MKFDIVFLDIVCTKPYNWETLENDRLGGTEGSTIRLAEGFGKAGYSVAVIQKWDNHPTTSPNGVKYLPYRWLDMVKPKNVIHLRSVGNLPKFNGIAKQFVWLHDAGDQFKTQLENTWNPVLEKYSATPVCVSDWHQTNLLSCGLKQKATRIYSPLDETCYSYPRGEHDKNQLVWLSSPHKGLVAALVLFQEKIRSQCPEMKIAVFNPGYFDPGIGGGTNIVMVKNATRATLRNVASHSLCLFYPTSFEETFGLVAAESEALGLPVATYKTAALAESVRDSGWCDSPDDLVSKVMSWQEKRPVVSGQERFLLTNILPDWVKLLQ